MEKYCCFLHPKKDYKEKKLTDLCPDCKNPYGFPMLGDNVPSTIGDFKVIHPIDRGYYGVTYVVEKETTIRIKKQVLKVVPVEIYKFFKKDFEKESKDHADAADGTNHIVNIDEIFKTKISFGDIEIECHVAIMDYVQGDTLKNLMGCGANVPASMIGQIAIDLLLILSELKKKTLFHNDLHPGNIIIEKLEKDKIRIGEINNRVKAVAIDFGSLGSKTQSGDGKHLSDLHQVANILIDLSRKLLDNPQNINERDYRLASLLEERGRLLLPKITSQRHFEFEQVIDQIKNAFNQVHSPWKATLNLKNHRDYINAQTLDPWFVPSLLVDTEDKWVNEVSNKGPQVITGMRGCGKTMLIRALQFHAQAIQKNDKELPSEIIKRINQEGYVGLYVSCIKLLDKQGEPDRLTHEPFTRLFVAYALEAIYAIRHLRELDSELVQPDAFVKIASVIADFVEGSALLRQSQDEYKIERILKDILNSLSKRENKYTINSNPAIAFPQLAETISQCSPVWQDSYIFFLLDDVSTRYLKDENIITLVSSLLFQNERCAFKFTTEAQTLHMVLLSPGNIEQARIGRDYSIFDLGNKVDEKIHSNKHEGIKFVETILFKRSKFQSNHPKGLKPSEILGDKSLVEIAKNIGKPGKASEKKEIYHGITAIASVCVGDIGDVITLYEMILKRRNGKLPIPARDQNECYLELSNSRLFDINRRDGKLYDFAESFANAAHSLLVQSFKASQSKPKDKRRLRQYSSIFINITSGDKEKQNSQVRALIDAGIFNFSGGPEASRTNRQGVNPQNQFKLSFRKLYGVNKHIGLANADRFELSGHALEDWLDNPKKGKEILTRNLKSITGDSKEQVKIEDEYIVPSVNSGFQQSLFEEPHMIKSDDGGEYKIDKEEIEALALEKLPNLTINKFKNWQKSEPYPCLIAGLGFENRTLESFRRSLNLKPKTVSLLRFGENGKREEMLSVLNEKNIPYSEFGIEGVINNQNRIDCQGVVDITGLPKAVIFNIIRSSLLKKEPVSIVYTEARAHYPLDHDIQSLLEKHKHNDQTQFLESLTKIIKGEKGPYKLIPLLPLNTENYAARRVLIAFSSPKHERLYSLLDEREYDKIHIIAPPADCPRNELAKIAAEVALRKFNHAEIIEFPNDNLKDLMEYLATQYQHYFVDQNYSFEIALTGSKIQAIASAVISSVFKVSQCWYVQPAEWDPNRFTSGTDHTVMYKIKF
ncbi:AarF/UbiB family protein [Christiangramia crocea]|uniref:Protein kinase domain-containing protein n=1 Tax=Christiangramia crocea TaxID=2904124 RepID=A0A9X1UV68_9FLAO|nr:AarF/UbiB family protein [Gramella crocea]MCG9970731.1 hypothetical protein [Gramella crocea]